MKRWTVRSPRSSPTHDGNDRPRLLIVVEGRHDVEFLKRIGAIVHAEHPELPDLAALERHGVAVFIPAGGNDFRPWLVRLAPFGRAEFHLIDRELPPVSAERERWAAEVNRRPRCRAFVTGHRSLENYLHPTAIYEAIGLRRRASGGPCSGRTTSCRVGTRCRAVLVAAGVIAKAWLNTTAVERMTVARLAESDPDGEVVRWLTAIADLVASL